MIQAQHLKTPRIEDQIHHKNTLHNCNVENMPTHPKIHKAYLPVLIERPSERNIQQTCFSQEIRCMCIERTP